MLAEALSDDGGVYRLELMEAVPTGLQQFVVDSGLMKFGPTWCYDRQRG